jgi:hypothetical protein
MRYVKMLKKIKKSFIASAYLALFVYVLSPLNYVQAATASFYLKPTSQSINYGSTFNVEIRLNASTQAVDTAQVHLTWDTSKLQLVGSISHTNSAFTILASDASVNGNVNFTKAQIGGVNEDVQVATFSLKMIGDTGTLNFESDTIAYSAGTNVTGANSNSTYNSIVSTQPSNVPVNSGNSPDSGTGGTPINPSNTDNGNSVVPPTSGSSPDTSSGIATGQKNPTIAPNDQGTPIMSEADDDSSGNPVSSNVTTTSNSGSYINNSRIFLIATLAILVIVTAVGIRVFKTNSVRKREFNRHFPNLHNQIETPNQMSSLKTEETPQPNNYTHQVSLQSHHPTPGQVINPTTKSTGV